MRKSTTRKISALDSLLEDVAEMRAKEPELEHSKFTRRDWKNDVASNQTDLGYWDWVSESVAK